MSDGKRLCIASDSATVRVLKAVECSGKQVHDANLVATMLVNGIDAIVTINVDDFARFSDYVDVVNPRSE